MPVPLNAMNWNAISLAARSLLWAALLPGFFAGYLPWRYFRLREAEISFESPLSLVGLACIALGVALLAACIWEFARSGRGTLSPADPPRTLVVQGLYRYVRNPMYLSVTTILLGEVLLTSSRALFVVLGRLVHRREPVCHRLRGTDAPATVWRVLRSLHTGSSTLAPRLRPGRVK